MHYAPLSIHSTSPFATTAEVLPCFPLALALSHSVHTLRNIINQLLLLADKQGRKTGPREFLVGGVGKAKIVWV